MSFASQVKNEIAHIELCQTSVKAQLSAMIQLLASLSFSSSGMKLQIRTSNSEAIRRMSKDLKSTFDVKADIVVIKQTKLSKNNMYMLVVEDKIKEILNELDLWTDKGLLQHPRLGFLSNDEMIKSYLAGSFLATGSINAPQSTSYHLEVRTTTQSLAEFIQKLLERYYIKANIIARRKEFIVYIKSSEGISDFLKLIGANQAVMEFEDVRIQRDFINSLHRLDNVKIANEQKSQKVADEQLEAIEYLQQRDLIKYLSAKDQEIVKVRYENPYASLMELAEIYENESGISLSKSGIRHRFNKVFDLVKQYKEREKNQ